MMRALGELGSKISTPKTIASSPKSMPKTPPLKKNLNITKMGGAWSSDKPFWLNI
jgi:hypothetical protein